MNSVVLWLLYLGPRYFSALVPLLLPNTLNFRQVLSLRKLEGSFDVFCCSPSSSSILGSQSWNGTIAIIPAPDNELARLLPNLSSTANCLVSNTFCFLLRDIGKQPVSPPPTSVTGLNPAGLHRSGQRPLLPVCPAGT